MELTKKQIEITKGIVILFMLLLHLFCAKEYTWLFTHIIMIGSTPLIYYLALWRPVCCNGYDLMIGYENNYCQVMWN